MPSADRQARQSARFEPSGPLRGTLSPPADKSISHRAALFAAMCDEPVTIRGFLDADDTLATLDAVRSLGAGVDARAGEVVVRGVGLRTAQPTTGGLIDVRNAGTLLRILPGWLAGQPGGEWTLDGDESIRRRPVDRVAEPLRGMGAEVDAREGRHPPLTVRGRELVGRAHELPMASAQVKSCLLVAGMLAQGETSVLEPAASRDHTERLLPGWLAGQPGGEWTLDGDESIRRRPVDRVVEPLRLMGARMDAREGRYTPLTVRGADLRGIHYTAPVASAQVKSCVLIAGMLAAGSTTLTEISQSRDHTERILCRSRVPFERDGLTITVAQVDELELDEITVPGDPSSAAFLVAAACLVPGSRVVISDVGLNWTRTGFFRIAQRMGAVLVGELEEPGAFSDQEPVGELDVAHGVLEATEVGPDEVAVTIDELTLVALLGAFAHGETVVRGAAELRHKESDRIAGVVHGLAAIGADIEETGDGFAVRGDGSPLEGGVLDAQGDHRLAMLGAVAGLASENGVEVVGMDAAAISYPAFEQDLKALLS